MARVAVVGGCRTPFVKAGGVLSSHTLLSLGTHVVTSLISRLSLRPEEIDEIAFGTVLLDPRTPNLAREIVLRGGLPATVAAHSVSNNCITGLVATSLIAEGIRTGRLNVGLAGGSEAMSRPTLTLHEEGEKFFLRLARSRTMKEKLQALSGFRPQFLLPIPPSPKEPTTGMTMGEHCELMAKEFKISRETQDEIALRSHKNTASASAIHGEEIAGLDGVTKDNLVRGDTSIEKLAKLPPVFDRSSSGTLTAGNSSPLTDGASVVCLMSEAEARRQGREILAYIEGMEFTAIAPKDGLLMAPATALPRLLKKHNLTVSEIDLFEIHEAFGAQVAANLLAWKDGWPKYEEAQPIGEIPLEKINIQGGSIAIGHPFAATGGRMITSLANMLKRHNLKRGVISICAAGAMAGVVLLVRE